MTVSAFFLTPDLRLAVGPRAAIVATARWTRSMFIALPIALSLQCAMPSMVQANPIAGGVIGAAAGGILGGILGGGEGAGTGALLGGTLGALVGAGADKKPQVALPIAPPPYVAPSGLVMSIQQSLTLQGYNPGPIDGVMGFSTREAIKAYQRNNGLPVTGQPSQALARHMLGNGPSGTTTISGARPGLVSVVGVGYDDVLNVRSAPSSRAALVGSLSPVAKGIRRYECLVPAGASTEWCKVRKGSVTGWVAARFLAPQIVPAPQPPFVAMPQ